MKQWLLLCLLVIITVGLAAQRGRHVVLISIDGLRPDFYLDKSWPTPNLQGILKEGVYAEHMRSVFPSYTYPAHVAMLTGALPARSRIYYNAPRGSKGEWNWFTSAIKVPTLWQAIKKAELTSSAIEWPVSVDENINYDIPEIWNTVHPDDRITETRKYATPGLIEEIERNATGNLDSINMHDEYLSMDENAGRMAAYIFKTYQPNLLALHLACVDEAQHSQGRYGDSVRLAIASADRAIGDVLEAIERSGMKDSTTVIIVGDHGFSDINTVLRPNILIKELNARFQSAGGSAFLYGDKNEVSKVEAILDTCNQRSWFRIIERKELDIMGADSNAILALAAVPGIVFSGSDKGNITGIIRGGHHGYDPNLPEMYTGFIAAGAGIYKGKVIKELCVTDIALLIAKLLGIDFRSPDGKLVPGILKSNN